MKSGFSGKDHHHNSELTNIAQAKPRTISHSLATIFPILPIFSGHLFMTLLPSLGSIQTVPVGGSGPLHAIKEENLGKVNLASFCFKISLVFADGQIRLILTEIISSGG